MGVKKHNAAAAYIKLLRIVKGVEKKEKKSAKKVENLQLKLEKKEGQHVTN